MSHDGHGHANERDNVQSPGSRRGGVPDIDFEAEHDPARARKLGRMLLQRHAKNRNLDRKPGGDASAIESQQAPGQPHATALVDSAASDAGAPLPEPLREKFESSLGADLSGVRVHTGGASQAAAESVGAKAYTTGQDIHFGAGEYDPSSKEGQHLLAHEVAHTVQQGNASNAQPQGKLEVSSPGDTHEKEADRAADAMTVGAAASVSSVGSAVVQRKLHGGSAHSSPSIAPSDVYAKCVTNGQRALLGFVSVQERTHALLEIVVAQATAKAIHEQAERAYDAAKKAREKALAKSDLEKVLTAITTLIDLGTGVAGIIKAAKAVHTSALGLRDAYKMHKATGGEFGIGIGTDLAIAGGKAVGEGVKSGNTARTAAKQGAAQLHLASSFDPETILPDTNAAAIAASNKALDALTENQIKYNFIDTNDRYRGAALDLAQMVHIAALLTDEHKVMPDEAIKEIDTIIARSEEMNRHVQATLGRVRDTWNAYLAGGAEAIADPRERTLFERIQHWSATGDKRINSLRIAMDQSMKNILFSGNTALDTGALGGITYYCYEYSEQLLQSEQGTLYIDDSSIAAELQKEGLLAPDITAAFDRLNEGAGAAETTENDRGGQKFWISISMCKALEALGVRGTVTSARINFFGRGGVYGGRITNKHKGSWFDRWKDTAEFESFWRSSLGAQYAYIKKVDGDKEELLFATDEQKEKSRHINQMPRPRR